MKKQHAIFDTEIIGLEKPVFLLCVKILETGEKLSFWHHKRGHRAKAIKLMERNDLTWVSFNGIRFDMPLLAAWVMDRNVHDIKALATAIIRDRMMWWDAYQMIGCKGLEIDHIDLFEVAPGQMTSLKTYAGRMGYPSMIDLPFHHDQNLNEKECKILEEYCFNDLGVTEALFLELKGQVELREIMSLEHDIDLRSKSDAQIAEAIMKKKCNIGRATGKKKWTSVKYVAPDIIKTRNKVLLKVIKMLEDEEFQLNKGYPIIPDWLADMHILLNGGEYNIGMGGLHSVHDKNVHHEIRDDWEISDFDVGSYYPTIILKLGFVPEMAGDKGHAFLTAYGELYDQRLTAKEIGDKIKDLVLKICLNGLFGKLGSSYCAFYSPDLLLGVTISGQLNLLWVIDQLGRQKGVTVLSANTDGIIIGYDPKVRQNVLDVFAKNSKQTGFSYGETRYSQIAMKDVNNYIAVKLDNKIKAKGLYSEAGLAKNPTTPICSTAAAAYLTHGTLPEATVNQEKSLMPFLSIRNVKGGGEQGGVELGRVARWYMTQDELPPIRYVSNGNLVPKTEGARACMKLPDKFPKDLDRQWYVNETYDMLEDMGVVISNRL